MPKNTLYTIQKNTPSIAARWHCLRSWQPHTKLYYWKIVQIETDREQKLKDIPQKWYLRIQAAAENGNRAAEGKFRVSEIFVRSWRKAKVTLTAIKETKRAYCGLKASWPELEEQVQRLSTVQLRLCAQEDEYKWFFWWTYLTTVCQKLPKPISQSIAENGQKKSIE